MLRRCEDADGGSRAEEAGDPDWYPFSSSDVSSLSFHSIKEGRESTD
jgi:hypothetical protein